MNILTSIEALFIYLALWWLYSAVGTYVLGTQVGGRRLAWGITGLLLGPVGMLAALVIPAIQGRIPQTTRTRWTALGFTFGLLVISEVFVRSDGGQSALLYAFLR